MYTIDQEIFVLKIKIIYIFNFYVQSHKQKSFTIQVITISTCTHTCLVIVTIFHHIPESVCRLCIDRLLKYYLVTLILQPLSRLTKHIQNCSRLSPYQYTPLHEAAASGHIDTVQYLVYKGAEINIKSNDGVSERTVMLIRV